MATYIQNTSDVYYPELVSYGWELRLYEDFEGGTMPFRLKVGVEIEDVVTGAILGRVETDAFGEGTWYRIEIGDAIKQAIANDTAVLLAGAVYDPFKRFKFTPYSKSRGIDTAWSTTFTEANAKEFLMQRGINDIYYTNGNASPTAPTADFDLLATTGISNYTMPLDGYQWLYAHLPSTSKTYYSMEYVTEYWGTNKTTQNYELISTDTVGDFDLRGSDTTFYRLPLSVTTVQNNYDIEKKIITVTTYKRSSPGEGIVETYVRVLDISLTCASNTAFKINLAFLDNSFLWRAIPFYLNNEVTTTRNTTTIERYDRSRHDIVNEVRSSYTVKSDYLSKVDAEAFMLYGISSLYKIIDASEYGGFQQRDARLVSSATMLKHPSNESLIQIECTIEASNILLTA